MRPAVYPRKIVLFLWKCKKSHIDYDFDFIPSIQSKNILTYQRRKDKTGDTVKIGLISVEMMKLGIFRCLLFSLVCYTNSDCKSVI